MLRRMSDNDDVTQARQNLFPPKALLTVLGELKPLREEFPPILDPAPDGVEL